jgi:hypothetical protein
MLAVWRGYVHPGILFSPNEIPTERGDDGSIMVDPRERISLSEQTDAWTDRDCDDAYKILAHLDYSDVERGCMAGLMCQYIGRYELTAISEKWGEGPVPFSKRPVSSTKIDRQMTVARVVSWFQGKIDAREWSPQQQLCAEADREFSISSYRFGLVWREFAPEEWRLPGRPRGSGNRK